MVFSLRFEDYRLITALFIRLLGAVYLVAFTSLSVQVLGLAGSEGILPAGELLAFVAENFGHARYVELPTLFWIHSGDFVLVAAVFAGILYSLQLMIGYHQRTALVMNYLLYLSLYSVCQPFLFFQWDGLLLEAGFLAIFLGSGSPVIIWLFRWLLFKLRFMSGLAKLTSGDPAWSGLTALNTYFEVQPLPNPVAWYVHQLPEIVLRAGALGTLVVELLVPFMMFMPRRWRFAAAWITILWQVLIMVTSNHNWINLLTIMLCLFLFDDRALNRVLPRSRKEAAASSADTAGPTVTTASMTAGILAVMVMLTSVTQLYALATRKEPPLGRLNDFVTLMETWRIANMYHVFPTMPAQRIELELYGTYDGIEWRQYRFKYKPGKADERPQFIIPHQPRLDWQVWFVPKQPRQLPWFEALVHALLENRPAATGLLEHNPFPDRPPDAIRVDAVRYSFTTFEQRDRTGRWWNREPLGPFLPFPGTAQVSQ